MGTKVSNAILRFQAVAVAIFCISLVWDVIFPSNILVSLLLLTSLFHVFLGNGINLGRRHIRDFTLILLFFLGVSFLHLNLYSGFSQELFDSNLINLLLSIQLIWIIPLLYQFHPRAFCKAIDIALWILGSVFIIQLFTYYTLGKYFDVLQFFSGRESKYMAYNFMLSQTGLNIIRPTSIFNEPGTYCSYSFVLFALSFLNHGRAKKIHIFILSTYLISLSAFGLLIAGISFSYLFIVELNRRRKKKKGIFAFLLMMSPFLSLITYFLFQYYQMRFQNSSSGGGVELRYDTLSVYESNPIEDRLLGLTFGYNQIESFHVQDASLLFSMILFLGGFVIVLLIILFIVRFKLNFQIITFFLLIGATKIDFFSFALWLFIAAAPMMLMPKKFDQYAFE